MKKLNKDNIKVIEEWVAREFNLLRYVNENKLAKVSENNSNKFYCPFHTDEVPSLYISDDNKFKCFSCGRGGGFVKFYVENLNYERGTHYNYYQGMEIMAKELKAPVTQLYLSEESTLKVDLTSKVDLKSKRRSKLQLVNIVSLASLIKDAYKANDMDKVVSIINDCINDLDDSFIIQKNQGQKDCLVSIEQLMEGD